MNDNGIYFNFPIQLLAGFMENTGGCLSNIMYYSVYKKALQYGEGTSLNEYQLITASLVYFNIKPGNEKIFITEGKKLNNQIPANSPKVGISISVFWDFYQNDKQEFEKICLLAFLAIKSMVQTKAYFKATNNYWLGRMDGKPKGCEKEELSDEIRKYSNEYQTKKIKRELVNSWGLVTYSRYNRGFYVSFKMKLDDLVYIAESERKSTKEKQRKKAEQKALHKALLKLGVNDHNTTYKKET